MHLALGQFTFEMGSAPYRELRRSMSWRHAQSERIGARPAHQFLGPGDSTISITGAIFPGVAGRHSALVELETMADQGEAQPLVAADGNVLGSFVITSMERAETHFVTRAGPRKADFSIELTRVS